MIRQAFRALSYQTSRALLTNFSLLVGIGALTCTSAFAEGANPQGWPAVSLGTSVPHEFQNPTLLPNELWPIAENANPFDFDRVEQRFNPGTAEFTLAASQRFQASNSSKPPSVLSGAPGETVTLDLSNFILRGHDTFTLQGSSITNFIINVSGRFSLSNKAAIVLSGEVQWNNVSFNVIGQGSAVSISNRAILRGTLTAAQRTVRINNQAVVYGTVVAGNLRLSGAAHIVLPPVVSN